MQQRMMTYKQYLDQPDSNPCYVLIDLDTCPIRVRTDYERRNHNVSQGYPLCSECDGTGNEFMNAYKQCHRCGGVGIGV